MLLQALREYGGRIGPTPSMYVETAIRYVIDLDGNGRFLGLVDTADPSTPAGRRGRRMLAPSAMRTALSIRPKLLADNGEYTLGVARDVAKQARVVQCREAYRAVVEECARDSGHPAMAAVAAFL